MRRGRTYRLAGANGKVHRWNRRAARNSLVRRAYIPAMRVAHRFFGPAALVALAAVARPAWACGLTPPVGPNGLPTVCHGESSALRFHAGLAVGGTSTRIDFDRGGAASLLQGATVAALDVQPTDALTLSVSAGASALGHVDYGGTSYALLPGVLGGAGVAYRLFGRGGLPFVQPSLGFSLARATTRAPDGSELSFTAKDWRAGIVAGKAFGVVAPFVLARYFGGGTAWSAGGGHGADHYRYQLGAGSAFALDEHVDAVVELAILGERRATIGVGYTF